MKVLLCVTMLVALSVGNQHYGPRCYDKCTIITKFTDTGATTDYMRDLKDENKKCGDDHIKYCPKDETCNSFSFSAKVDVTKNRDAKKGNMRMTHHYCGAATDKGKDVPIRLFCDPIGTQMQTEFDKMDASAEFTVKNIELSCRDKKIESCDGTNECVKMSDHPDWKDPHDMSAGAVPKICTLLLAYPFLAPMM